MRDFKKYAELGKKKMSFRQEMRYQECLMLKHMADDDARDGIYNAFIMAYNAGFEAGARYEASEGGEDMSESKNKRGPQPVSYLAYESAQARMERVNKRLALLLAASLLLTGAAWIVATR